MADKKETAEKTEATDKVEKVDVVEKVDKAEKTEKGKKSEKGDKAEKSEPKKKRTLWCIPKKEKTEYELQQEKEVRSAYLRKVLGIVLLQLIATTVIVWVICIVEPVKAVFLRFRFPILIVTAIGTFIIPLFMKCVKEYPKDIIMLTIFTVLEALVLASWGMWVDYHLIVTAFGVTAGVTFCLILFALISKSDFSGLEPYLYQILFIGIIFGAMAFIVPEWVNIFTIISMSSFCIYLVADIKRLMRVKEFKKKGKTEMYALDALKIYMDVIGLYTMIFKCCKKNRTL